MIIRASCRLAAIVVFATALFCPRPLQAGDGFPPVTPEELKLTAEPLAPGASAIILYRQVDRDDSGSARAREKNYYRIKILTEEGRQYGNIEIPFLKGVDEVVHIQARTIQPDGTVADLDGKVFEKSLLKASKLNVMAKTFTLPAVEPGCIIEYSYTLNLERAYASHWILSEPLFTKNAQFSLKPYRGAEHIRWGMHNLPPGTEPKEARDKSVRMEVANIPAFQAEDFMPPEDELKSRVDFTYEIGQPESDPELYWKQVGKMATMNWRSS